MKIKENFVLRQVGDSSIVVAVGEETKNFNAMIKLNSTGVFLWKLLEKGATEEELLQKVLEKYDIDSEKAKCDIDCFVKKIKGANILD